MISISTSNHKRLSVSFVFAFLAAIIGVCIPYFNPDGDRPAKIQLVKERIAELFSEAKKATPQIEGFEDYTLLPHWSDIEGAVSELQKYNQEILLARAMIEYGDPKVTSYYSNL